MLRESRLNPLFGGESPGASGTGTANQPRGENPMIKTTNHRTSGTPSGIIPGALVLRLKLERHSTTDRIPTTNQRGR